MLSTPGQAILLLHPRLVVPIVLQLDADDVVEPEILQAADEPAPVDQPVAGDRVAPPVLAEADGLAERRAEVAVLVETLRVEIRVLAVDVDDALAEFVQRA